MSASETMVTVRASDLHVALDWAEEATGAAEEDTTPAEDAIRRLYVAVGPPVRTAHQGDVSDDGEVTVLARDVLLVWSWALEAMDARTAAVRLVTAGSVLERLSTARVKLEAALERLYAALVKAGAGGDGVNLQRLW